MAKQDVRRSGESGSLHAVIIAVLFVALMATLGIVFYQNFIASKPKAIETNKTIETESDITTRIAFNGDIYALDHPKDWTSHVAKTSESVDKATRSQFVSPNGKVRVDFVVSPLNIDQPCDPAEGLKISSYAVSKSVNTKLVDSPLYLVESISDYHLGDAYDYSIGLTPDSGATHAAVGESKCNIKSVGYVSTAVVGINKLAKPTILAMITFPKLFPWADVAIKEMKQVKDLMNTDEYKTAVKILESAHKE